MDMYKQVECFSRTVATYDEFFTLIGEGKSYEAFKYGVKEVLWWTARNCPREVMNMLLGEKTVKNLWFEPELFTEIEKNWTEFDILFRYSI